MPTLNQLAEEMALETGETFGDLDVAEQFRTWAQEAIDEVYADTRWFFKNATENIAPVAGVAEYQLTSTVSEIRDLTIPALTRRIAYFPVERINARGWSLSEQGTPRAWYHSGTGSAGEIKISLFPVPNAAFITAIAANPVITAHTLKRPPQLGDDDNIPLPQEYIRLLRDGVRYRVALQDKDIQSYEASRKSFMEGLLRLNQRFHGAEGGGSNLRIKLLPAARQAPGSPEGA